MPGLHFNHKVRFMTHFAAARSPLLPSCFENCFVPLADNIWLLRTVCVVVQIHTYTVIPKVLYIRRIGKRISLAFGSKGRISYS